MTTLSEVLSALVCSTSVTHLGTENAVALGENLSREVTGGSLRKLRSNDGAKTLSVEGAGDGVDGEDDLVDVLLLIEIDGLEHVSLGNSVLDALVKETGDVLHLREK